MDDLALEHEELMRRYLDIAVNARRDYQDAMDRDEVNCAANYAALAEIVHDMMAENMSIIEEVTTNVDIRFRAAKLLNAAKDNLAEVRQSLQMGLGKQVA